MPTKQSRRTDVFTRFASAVSAWVGRPWMFVAALGLLALWVLSGPLLGFSDTWQLIVNTSTSIVTFLIVFIIQNTQNRDNAAINIKLDALLNKLDVNDDELLVAEDESDKRLEHLKNTIQKRRNT